MNLKKIIYLISLSFMVDLCSTLIPLPLSADIYQWIDETGVIHFTNVPTEKKFQKVMKEEKGRVSKGSKTSSRYYISTPSTVSAEDYSGHIQSISEKYQVDPALVKAVIKAESNFNPAAISKKGARGLMQLMPQTASELNVRNSFNPAENIEGGVRYIRYLLDIFDGNLSLSLAAYNAGPELVQRLGRIPSIRETQEYVKKVLSLYNGTGLIGLSKERIYKIIYDDGTTIFTNTPYNYLSNQKSMGKM